MSISTSWKTGMQAGSSQLSKASGALVLGSVPHIYDIVIAIDPGMRMQLQNWRVSLHRY